jgi:cell division protein ZapA (FtsZ GTPase activity inhibitor)
VATTTPHTSGNWPALVDHKMREVAGRSSSVDRAKIAILAALNIADELARLRAERARRAGPRPRR